jgi:TPR repeat protein
MYWEDRGVTADRDRALKWLEAAADRGDIRAMCNLVYVYGTFLSLYRNLPEEKRWRVAVAEAEKLTQSITLVDPSGKADRGEPKIPDQDTRPTLPAPTNLRIVSSF